MKKISHLFIAFALFFSMAAAALALSKDDAITAYTDELVALGLEEGAASDKATSDVNALIAVMKATQEDIGYNFDSISERVDSLNKNDLRRDDALDRLDNAENLMDTFRDMDPEQNLYLQESIGGAPPRVTEGDDFRLAREAAEGAQASINRILIAPSRPGAVPQGDIVSDFIPQLIRQLFRFAWLAVLIALTASGVLMILAHGNEEKITKARAMIYYSLVGFAFIALAFAIVKGVTDIDFFRFI